MHHWLSTNVSLSDWLHRGRGNASEVGSEEWDFEEVVGGSAGGVGALALLVGLVVILHRYWGAIEPLARSLTDLVRAIIQRLN